MAERRRTTLLLLTALAAVPLSIGGFLAFRYYEGKQFLEEAKQSGIVSFALEPLKPRWLEDRLGDHTRPFERIVGARVDAFTREPGTNRITCVDACTWIDRLAKIRTLRRLDLKRNPTVTDDDIARLAATQPPVLEVLELSGTDIGDDALLAVAEMPRLRELYISLTLVSEHGIDRLRVTRPELRIVADPLTRRGLGSFRRRTSADSDRYAVHGIPLSSDMTIEEAACVGRIPNPIWIGVLSPLREGVMSILAKHRNIESLVLMWPEHGAAEIRLFSTSGSLKKITLYSTRVEEEMLAAICEVASLKELLLLGDEDSDLERKICDRRSDVRVRFERPELIGFHHYRYEP